MKILLSFILFVVILNPLTGQESGRLSGNFRLDAQYYLPDSLIGAPEVSEKAGFHSFSNVRYDFGNFSAGMRFEGYLNPFPGYDPDYEGLGLPYFFIQHRLRKLNFTVGDIYEQFGTGILLRTWEDKFLGVDNAIRGVRVKYQIHPSLDVTAIAGKIRNAWTWSEGMVRGLDANLQINELIEAWVDKPLRLTAGGSFVSKYQSDEDPLFNLPENVGAWSYRLNISKGAFRIETEYATKINDPSVDNNFIYKEGNALIINAGYGVSGFGVNLSARRVDNMAFRIDRAESLNRMQIGYLPAITRNFSYSLMNMYPYASQPTSEMGLQGEISWNIRRGSRIGGKYGTQISLNVALINSIKKLPVEEGGLIDKTGTLGYRSPFFEIGDTPYYRDYNLEINRKINRLWKVTGIYQYLLYNQLVLEGKGDQVEASVAVIDISRVLAAGKTIRMEAQGLWTADDNGNWAMLLLEYTVSPRWFLTLNDQYNYGNPDKAQRIHYLNGAIGFVDGSNRIQVGYGKQRAGILCVGGICRNVPAMNGFTLSVSSSF